MTITGFVTPGGVALTTPGGAWFVTGEVARYRLLKDHYISGNYIQASEIVSEGDSIPSSWIPSINVEPLNTPATQAYYDAGPDLGAVVRTQWTQLPVPRPVTYWYEVSSNLWALTGLGADQSIYPPIFANIGRIE